MNEFKFHYCIGNNKNKFNKYLKVSKNKSKLCINKHTYIDIEFCENNDEKFIEINFDDVENFIDFVHDKNLNCGGDFDHFNCDHNCRYSKYYSEYLDHIFKNNMLHHIESPQLKKYIVILNSLKHGFRDYKYSDIINDACEYSTLETIKYTMNLVSIKDIGNLICYACHRDDNNFKIFKYLVDLYCERLIGYLNRTIKKCDYYKMYYHGTLLDIAKTNNIKTFIYFTTKIPNTVNSINKKNITPKLLGVYNKILKSHEYSQKIKDRLLVSSIYYGNLNITPRLLSDGANIYSFSDRDINSLLKNNNIESIQFIIDNNMIDENKINKLFTSSYKYKWNIAQILVDNGANYKPYIKKLITNAEKVKNNKLLNYLKQLDQ
nr:hypothetical protein [Megavirus caiporensis]